LPQDKDSCFEVVLFKTLESKQIWRGKMTSRGFLIPSIKAAHRKGRRKRLSVRGAWLTNRLVCRKKDKKRNV